MKRLLIFLLFLIGVRMVDLKPISLDEYRDSPITVRIEGEVQFPGTYETERYTSVAELLERAHPTEEADLDTVNTQITLKDHDVLIIPAKQEEKRISINTASAEQLCTLPGIGEATAQKIVSYREENGLFQTTEDLVRVPGIGARKYEGLKDRICL